MWHYHLTSTPWRTGMTSGVVFGLIMAVPLALQAGPVHGLVGFALGGGFFGVLTGLSSRRGLVPLAGLSPADRVMVMCTVQRGLATTDRRLAPAVAGYAEALRRRTPDWLAKGGGALLFRILAVFQLLQGVLDALDRDWVGVALRLVLAGVALYLPRLNLRNAERRDRAERSARALLDAP